MVDAVGTFNCGRRWMTSVDPLLPQDSWRQDRHGGLSCSYCGSIRPDDLFAAIEAGQKITPTDKDYKIYVELLNANPDELRVFGSRNHEPGPGEVGWIKVSDCDPAILERDGYGKDRQGWVMLSPRGRTREDKFYFQHFSRDEQYRFIDLLNEGRVNFEQPGYFYVKPFFITYKPVA